MAKRRKRTGGRRNELARKAALRVFNGFFGQFAGGDAAVNYTDVLQREVEELVDCTGAWKAVHREIREKHPDWDASWTDGRFERLLEKRVAREVAAVLVIARRKLNEMVKALRGEIKAVRRKCVAVAA